MKKVLLVMGLLVMSGCSVLSTQVGPRLAKAVNRYCQEPEVSRMALRAEVNSLIAPNSAQVNCADDKVVGGQP